MKRISVLLPGLALLASVATAHAAQLSQSECTNLWNQANPSRASGLTESQSANYVTNFKAANPDGDKTIDANEWNAACKNGLVKSSSGSGSSAGEKGTNAPDRAE